MDTTATILPLVQPAWKVPFDLILNEVNTADIERAWRSLLSKAPYPIGTPSPTGHIKMHYGQLMVFGSLQIYHHRAFSTTFPEVAMETFSRKFEEGGFTTMEIAFLLVSLNYLKSRGYSEHSPPDRLFPRHAHPPLMLRLFPKGIGYEMVHMDVLVDKNR